MIAILFYFESNGTTQLSYLDQIVAMFGYEWFFVDKSGEKSGNRKFDSLAQAIADPRFNGHQFIYFDINATDFYEDSTPPVKNVVYVIGSDVDGYKKTMAERNGISYKLKTKSLIREYYAEAVIPYVLAYRWHKRAGAD